MENKEVLVFAVQNRLFGIDSSNVEEVLVHQFVSYRGEVSEPFAAIAKIRNKSIPLVCAGQRLGFVSQKINCFGNVIVLKFEHGNGETKFGVVVDTVEGLLTYDETECLPFSTSKKNTSFSAKMVGTVVCNKMPVYILDTMKFLGLEKILCDSMAQEEFNCVA